MRPRQSAVVGAPAAGSNYEQSKQVKVEELVRFLLDKVQPEQSRNSYREMTLRNAFGDYPRIVPLPLAGVVDRPSNFQPPVFPRISLS